jgi:hypothetical protein
MLEVNTGGGLLHNGPLPTKDLLRTVERLGYAVRPLEINPQLNILCLPK